MLSNSKISPCVMKNGALVWWLIFFRPFHIYSVSCQISTDDWVSIDCGNDDFLLDDNLVSWDSDDLYTDAGINQRIRVNQDHPLEVLSTLRSFPTSSGQSCYKLPIIEQNLRYLVRLGFLYGNYDGLNRPPAFDLILDGKKISAIELQSATEALFYEVVYTSERSGVMNLCLAQRKDVGVPFVSMIQAVPTVDDLYSKMEFKETFQVVARITYGRDSEGFSSSGDDYERIWTSVPAPPNCNNIFAITDFDSPENDPPPFVLEGAIESINASSPIVLTVDFPKSSSPSISQSAYFVLYFTEAGAVFDRNNRTIDIFIDGQKLSTITTSTHRCTVVTLYPVEVKAATVNVTLAAADSSAGFPPLISAMEVFTRVISTGGAGGAPSMHLTFLSSVLMLCICVLANLL